MFLLSEVGIDVIFRFTNINSIARGGLARNLINTIGWTFEGNGIIQFVVNRLNFHQHCPLSFPGWFFQDSPMFSLTTNISPLFKPAAIHNALFCPYFNFWFCISFLNKISSIVLSMLKINLVQKSCTAIILYLGLKQRIKHKQRTYWNLCKIFRYGFHVRIM